MKLTLYCIINKEAKSNSLVEISAILSRLEKTREQGKNKEREL